MRNLLLFLLLIPSLVFGANFPSIQNIQQEPSKIIYVDSTLGDDSYVGTASAPKKTIQGAWDSLPMIVTSDTVILLADGYYFENTRVDNPRKAVLFATGKFIAGRSDESGSQIVGKVVIRGTSRTGTVIQTTPTLYAGVYVSQGNVGLDTLTIDMTDSSGANALTSHRNDSYVHANNISIVGNGDDNGVYAESGGHMEVVGSSTISGMNVGVQAQGVSYITLANTTTVSSSTIGISVSQSSEVQVANQASISGTLYSVAIQDGTLFCYGNPGVGAYSNISGPVYCTNGTIDSTYCKWYGNAVVSASKVHLNASAFQNQWSLFASQLAIKSGTTSFIPPATTSSAIHPLVLVDTSYSRDNTSTIWGITNLVESLNPITNTVASNSFIDWVNTSKITTISGRTASATNCALASVSISLGGIIPPEGTEWTLYGNSFPVEILSSTTADLASGGRCILGDGTISSNSTSLSVIYLGGKWVEKSRSAIR